jgi:tetratricopeptide (TPR) repeat protein
MGDVRRTRFVGVGVGTYHHGQANLPAVHRDITNLRRFLDPDSTGVQLLDPTEHEARRCIEEIRDGQRREPVILAWSGHGVFVGHDLRLLASDSPAHASAGLSMRELVLALADSGTSQLLVIIDACHAGGGTLPALSSALDIHLLRTATRARIWTGVLASCQPYEPALDGVFGRRMCQLLTNGPTDPHSRRVWAPGTAYLTGDELGDAILRGWDLPDAQRPMYAKFGDALGIVRNPLYRPGFEERNGTAARVVEHILRAEPDEFVGRAAEVDRVTGWVGAGAPGLYLLTGSSGTGKSAILSRVGAVTGHPVVRARGRTARQLAVTVDHALVNAARLPALPGPATAVRLVDRLRRAAADGVALAVLVDDPAGSDVDGAETAHLLLRLAAHVPVVVAARAAPTPLDALSGQRRPNAQGPPSRQSPLGPRETLDLDDPAVARAGVADLRAYIMRRLTGVAPAMDPEAVADHVLALASRPETRPFLLARVVTDHLRDEPVDTRAPRWRSRVYTTVKAMFAADMAAVAVPPHRTLPEGVPAAALARHLLAALAWGYGTGFPEDEWVVVSDATGPLGMRIDRFDIAWVMTELGRYIVQDGEDGVATYRIAHETLAELMDLRPRRSLGGPHERAVATALIDRYHRLVTGGVPAGELRYALRYAGRHAVDSGAAGLRAFHDLAAVEPALAGQAALAEGELATRLADRGERTAARAHAERAVDLLRRLHPAGPEGGVDDLATALGNLGARYRDVGRPLDAAAATAEAIALYRQAVGPDVATVDVAALLSNLGVYLREAGRPAAALAAGQESVALFRAHVTRRQASSGDLAMALTGSAMSLLAVGRHVDALAAAQEAVRHYRREVAADGTVAASLANALLNLTACLRDRGRRDEAGAAAREAVDIHRRAVTDNRAAAPQLGNALTVLSACLRDLGRSAEACAAAREAVDLLRQEAHGEDAVRPHLGSALVTLSACLRELGHPRDAEAAAHEAADAYRRDSATGPAGLGRALSQLAAAQHALGRHRDAVAAAEESVRLLRDAVAAGLAGASDLGAALTNLSVFRQDADAPADALAAARDAVAHYRTAASAPRFRAGLAGALTNLGVAEYHAGSVEPAIAAIAEAVELFRRLARDRAGLLPLASALDTLGVFCGLASRHGDAVAAAEEAVERYRELAAENATLRGELANALENLGTAYRLDGRASDAAAAADEAVAHCRRDGARGGGAGESARR